MSDWILPYNLTIEEGKTPALIVNSKGEIILPHFWWTVMFEVSNASGTTHDGTCAGLDLYETGDASSTTNSSWNGNTTVVKSTKLTDYSDEYYALDIEVEVDYSEGGTLFGAFALGGEPCTFYNPPAGGYTSTPWLTLAAGDVDNITSITDSGENEISTKRWQTMEFSIPHEDAAIWRGEGALRGESVGTALGSNEDIRLSYDGNTIYLIFPHYDNFAEGEKVTFMARTQGGYPFSIGNDYTVPMPWVIAGSARVVLRRYIPKQTTTTN